MKNFNVKLFANAAATDANADAEGSTIALPGLRPGELKIKVLKLYCRFSVLQSVGAVVLNLFIIRRKFKQ